MTSSRKDEIVRKVFFGNIDKIARSLEGCGNTDVIFDVGIDMGILFCALENELEKEVETESEEQA